MARDAPVVQAAAAPGRSTQRSWRILRLTLGAALAVIAVWWARLPVLDLAGQFLVVEDSLQPAQAIVVLEGGQPFREEEAANLYAQGWAPRIVMIRGPSGERRAQILEQAGVPAAAIEVVDQPASGTLEELEVLAGAVGAAHGPVVLVTSPYHTRRTQLDWSRVTDGRVPGLVRPAWQDPFDSRAWWLDPQARLRVWHEYLGLVATQVGLRDS